MWDMSVSYPPPGIMHSISMGQRRDCYTFTNYFIELSHGLMLVSALMSFIGAIYCPIRKLTQKSFRRNKLSLHFP